MSVPQLIMRHYLCRALLIVLLCSACKKSNKPGQDTELPNTGTTISLKGSVVDESGRPIAGAIVKADGQQATTADNGSFSLHNVKTNSANVLLVDCAKTGYRSQIRRVTTIGGNNAALYVTLPYKDATMTFSADAGASAFLPGGVNVQIPAGAVVKADGSAFSGTVNLSVQHISTADPDFSLKIPGGDLSGVRTDGTPVVLYSFGMVDVEMTSAAGEKLQLKSGRSSTIKFPITGDQLGRAPNQIPLWHFDEATGIWKEEGLASREGNVYVGNVNHFSTWNVDAPLRTALVKGRVTDACANNVPLRGVLVTVGQITVQTDNDGNYWARIPAGVPFTLSVERRLNIGRTFTKEVAALAEGSTNVQDIVLGCGASVAGRITNCSGVDYASFVTMELDGNMIANTYTDAESRFQLYGPKGADVQIKLYNPSGEIVMTSASVPETDVVNNIGDIQFCAPDQNLEAYFLWRDRGHEQGFIIHGGTAIGVTDNGGGKTTCAVQSGQLRVSLTIPGMAIGNYQSGHVVLEVTGTRYIGDKMEIKVTRFGVIGEKIEGTFSGMASPVGGGDKVEIINGRFTVRRIAG